jgi:hypothetical protein
MRKELEDGGDGKLFAPGHPKRLAAASYLRAEETSGDLPTL